MSPAQAEAFMKAMMELARNEKDRGPLAVLRRSLAFKPGTYLPALRYVEPRIGDAEGWAREACYLVAGLFALHPLADHHTLAHAMAQVYRSRGESIQRRFLTLLDSDTDQLPDRLRRVVALAKAAELGINWVQLLCDLLQWNHRNRRVQQEWARTFFKEASTTGETSREEVASA